MGSGCSLLSIWLTFEVVIYQHVGFAIMIRSEALSYARCMYLYSALIHAFPTLVSSHFVICPLACSYCYVGCRGVHLRDSDTSRMVVAACEMVETRCHLYPKGGKSYIS
ncbi:hypothetical protein DFH94DRAFT_702518 [Russula ochroleuca]|uniref:Uncharacterized protein n=1 Tax=Russula ochroleuca TaxID=152965 RepID=A0A9P5TDT0_9AGAM|nr:hypothetical protein DFH94DRAFT_702518 [Russula ochroleuca]